MYQQNSKSLKCQLSCVDKHSPHKPVVLQEHPEDPCGCVKVEITVDGMALSKIMVHHQYASFDPAISSQEV